MLWIPEDGNLKTLILKSEHHTKVAGHMGQDKTIELIRRNFWWPKMIERIIDFVRSCPKCQKNKATRHQPYGLSSPLELPYAPWQSIAMDLITELPLSEECDQLWVVIDRFTKMAHCLPIGKEKKRAADLAVIFTQEIWKKPRATLGHRLRPGLTIHLRDMARIPVAIRYSPKDVDGLPPPNRRANRMPQPDNRGVAPSVRRPRTRQLGRPTTDSGVCLQ